MTSPRWDTTMPSQRAGGGALGSTPPGRGGPRRCWGVRLSMVSATQAAAGSADAVGLGAAVTGALVAGEAEAAGSLVAAGPVPPAHPATTNGSTPQVPTRSRRAGRGRVVGRFTRRRYVTDPVPDERRARGRPASAMIVAMASIPVILDVDTGVDDACALLLAGLHPGLDLRAVTCVAG